MIIYTCTHSNRSTVKLQGNTDAELEVCIECARFIHAIVLRGRAFSTIAQAETIRRSS